MQGRFMIELRQGKKYTFLSILYVTSMTDYDSSENAAHEVGHVST
jgi:hypothetical protein